jgi:hypothetical protein
MEYGMPLIGDKFPRLEVVTTRGTKVLPDEYKSKWFILFSRPAVRRRSGQPGFEAELHDKFHCASGR